MDRYTDGYTDGTTLRKTERESVLAFPHQYWKSIHSSIRSFIHSSIYPFISLFTMKRKNQQANFFFPLVLFLVSSRERRCGRVSI